MTLSASLKKLFNRDGTLPWTVPLRDEIANDVLTNGWNDEVRSFTSTTTSAVHIMNAVSEGTKVHLAVRLYNGNCFTFFKSPDGKKSAPQKVTIAEGATEKLVNVKLE